jgi:hypothetical protein
MFQVQIRSHRMGAERPDLSLLEGVVADRILEAMRAAAVQLKAAGITHALAGALAVGAHGYPRASKDVDFVVGPEAFTTHEGGLITINPGVPVRVGDVAVDPISVGAEEPHLLEALRTAQRSQDIPVLSLEALVYMKLKSPRRKDAVDVVELLKAGADAGRIAAYLERHAPALGGKLKQLASEAEAE